MDPLLITLLTFTLWDVALAQVCLTALNTDSSMPSEPPLRDRDREPLPSSNAVQAIIPTYNFSCCVNITSWETYMHPDGASFRNNGLYDIKFQVWRPSSNEQNGTCYTLVGQNVFNSVTFVANSRLVQFIPQGDNIIAHPGDIVGYYTISRGDSDEGIQLERSEEYSQNEVLYHSNDGSSEALRQICRFSQSDSITLSSTNAAPVLRASTIITDICTKLVQPSSPLTYTTKLYTNSLLQSISSTAQDPNLNTNSSGRIVLLASTISIVIIVLVISLLIMALVLFLLKQKRRLNQVQPSIANALDISNPNYAIPNFNDKPKESFRAKQRKWKPKSIEEPAGFKKSTTVIYKKNKQSMSIAQRPHSTNLDGNYTQDQLNHVQYRKGSNQDTEMVTITVRKESTNLPRNGTNEQSNENIYHVSENPADTSTIYHVLEEPQQSEYEEPIDSMNSDRKRIFESEGYYVPTLEERNEYGVHCTDYHIQKYSKLKFFVEDEIYWTPANSTTELYSQLSSKKYREIPRHQIRLQELLGSGQFGEVYKATWTKDQHKLELAIKMLKSGASDNTRIKFLQEAAIMGQFNHINVIKMNGVITIGEPIYICCEFLENGDLLKFLKNLKISGRRQSDFKTIQQMFLRFAKDIARGMSYLSQKNFVHRDLAARNILLNKGLTCKVADFGMARNLMDEIYYTSTGGKIPIKWTAPEVLLYQKSSTKSDVWSYGMVLFEIWSVGKIPFSNYINTEVLNLIQERFCQPPPPGCPRFIYKLMIDCWNPEYKSRPSFMTLCETLKQPSDILLHWEENNHLPSTAGICGGPLKDAKLLHLKLQKAYKN